MAVFVMARLDANAEIGVPRRSRFQFFVMNTLLPAFVVNTETVLISSPALRCFPGFLMHSLDQPLISHIQCVYGLIIPFFIFFPDLIPYMSTASDHTGNADTVIRVEGLYKRFVMGDTVVRALDGVSFTISRGSFVAIMGPSGSGKTTLLDILGCLSRPTEGDYWLAGSKVSNLSDRQLARVRNHEIGFVFQNFNLLARSSALVNVELPLFYDGVRRRERTQRAIAALTAVGLENRLHHCPNELSGGQRQRVAIARALINSPSIIFADEPTGNLDTASGSSIMGLFENLHQKGHTIVMVTHERDIAEHAERIMSFRDGRLVTDEWLHPKHSN